jgi:protein O-GlcNAc transferase
VLGSRLMLVNVPAGRARERIVSWLQLAGIDSDRLELHAHLPTRDFWAAHGHADIALDPFPCNGGATTCETLWLGVPVITLAGSKFVGRAGVSLLTNCGLPQLIADSRAQYIDLAVGLAQDAKRLQELRLGLRARLLASPLLDGPEFTRALEAHYRGIWRDWCIQRDRGHA